ncbi:MAG: complex I subunit 1 family protein [Thermofilaceae archaeon]
MWQVGYIVLRVIFISGLALLFEWLDRKFVAKLQNRIGPRYTGPFGALQPFADFIKLLSKEDVVPEGTKLFLFNICPVAAVLLLFIANSLVPTVQMEGILTAEGDLIIILAVITLYLLTIYTAGSAASSRYSLMGATRAAIMLLGFELPLMFSSLSVGFAAGSFELSKIVAKQSEKPFIAGPHLIGFIIFLIAAQAELEKLPFDIPEAETEIVSGWLVEFSSWRLAFFKFSRDLELVLLSGLATALYLGGPTGPVISGLEAFLHLLYFFIKSISVLFLFSLLSTLFARIRLDQFIGLCWRYLIPLALAYFIAMIWVV